MAGPASTSCGADPVAPADTLLPPVEGAWLAPLRLLAREYRGVLIMLYGGIVLGGLLWQRYLLRERDPERRGSGRRLLPAFVATAIPYKVPRRAVLPWLFGMLVVTGTAVYSGFESGFLTPEWWQNVIGALALSAVLVFKAWFGPAVVSLSLAYSIHALTQGGAIQWLPIIQGVVEWCLRGLPDSIYQFYTYASLAYVAATSIGDSLSG